MMPEPDSRLASELLRQSLSEGKQPYVTVASDSMLPLLRRGDLIQICDIQVEELQRGDIIVVGAPAELTVHRFWGVYRRDSEIGLLTKGDHRLQFDPLFPAAALIGRVTGRQRNNRQLILTGGVGGWLNNRLAGVVALEVRLLSVPPGTATAGSLLEKDEPKVDSPTRQMMARLTHSVLYFVSTMLTTLAAALTQTKVRA